MDDVIADEHKRKKVCRRILQPYKNYPGVQDRLYAISKTA